MSLSKVIKMPSLLKKLRESDYTTLDEVKKECLSSLTKELELHTDKVKAIDKLGAKDNAKKRKIDHSLTMEIESSFTTAVKNFDRLFVYGISPKKITEICGESGTGKTQLCMQMAVTIQLLKSQGGSEGECVYIDTEGSFNALRVQKIAERFGLKEPLKGIYVFRVLNHTELVAIIMQLTEILTNRTRVKLVIIDSMAYHLRLNTFTFRGRIDFLNFAGSHLIKIAKDLTVSIVATNHVTTDGASDTWTPSLGNEWGNWCANRLFLFRKRKFRFGHVYKSVEETERADSVQFCIMEKGLFDPENEEAQVAFKRENTPSSIPSPQQTCSVQEIANVHNTDNTISGSDSGAVPLHTTNNDHLENDKMDEESNRWASDGEEEWDLDFLANIQSYF